MLVTVAIIIIAIGCVHSMLGEKMVITPLVNRDDIPKKIRRLLRVAWHITTLFWFAIAAQLIAMNIWPDQAFKSFLIIMSVAFGISTLISLINSKGKHISWIGFLAATVLLGYQAAVL